MKIYRTDHFPFILGLSKTLTISQSVTDFYNMIHMTIDGWNTEQWNFCGVFFKNFCIIPDLNSG